MILNITYQGQSADYQLALDTSASDADIRRIATEVVRSGGIRGLHAPHLTDDVFRGYVVDRLRTPNGEPRIYLRPKVPFGSGGAIGAGTGG
jgi:hypothetical protein